MIAPLIIIGYETVYHRFNQVDVGFNWIELSRQCMFHDYFGHPLYESQIQLIEGAV